MECTVTCMVLNFEWCFKLLLSSLMQTYVFYEDFWWNVVFIDYLYFYYLCSVLSYVEMTHAAQIPRVQFKQGITKELFWKGFFYTFFWIYWIHDATFNGKMQWLFQYVKAISEFLWHVAKRHRFILAVPSVWGLWLSLAVRYMPCLTFC